MLIFVYSRNRIILIVVDQLLMIIDDYKQL